MQPWNEINKVDPFAWFVNVAFHYIAAETDVKEARPGHNIVVKMNHFSLHPVLKCFEHNTYLIGRNSQIAFFVWIDAFKIFSKQSKKR